MESKKTNRGPRYEEYKGRVNISLTKTGLEQLDEVASQFGLNRSEFIERIARRQIIVSLPSHRLGERLAS